jgi:hypothetical protein
MNTVIIFLLLIHAPHRTIPFAAYQNQTMCEVVVISKQREQAEFARQHGISATAASRVPLTCEPLTLVSP